MKKQPTNSEIFIDETKHRTTPTIFQRLKSVCISIVMGIVFAQVFLFAFRFLFTFLNSSLVYYFLFYTKLSIAYLLICAFLGWVYGDKFIQTLSKKSGDWWNLWGYWR